MGSKNLFEEYEGQKKHKKEVVKCKEISSGCYTQRALREGLDKVLPNIVCFVAFQGVSINAENSLEFYFKKAWFCR